MPGVRAVILLALAGSVGLLFLVLGCALPQFSSYWPLFVMLFYVLAPIPLLIAKRFQDDMASSSACTEFALFATAGIVLSAFALPIVLSHAGVVLVQWGGFALVSVGNIACFLTILAYFYVFRDDEGFGYNIW